jgi:hypothetical protein
MCIYCPTPTTALINAVTHDVRTDIDFRVREGQRPNGALVRRLALKEAIFAVQREFAQYHNERFSPVLEEAGHSITYSLLRGNVFAKRIDLKTLTGDPEWEGFIGALLREVYIGVKVNLRDWGYPITSPATKNRLAEIERAVRAQSVQRQEALLGKLRTARWETAAK